MALDCRPRQGCLAAGSAEPTLSHMLRDTELVTFEGVDLPSASQMLCLEGRAWVRMNWAVSTPYPSAAMAASWVDTGSPFRWRSCIKTTAQSKKGGFFQQPTAATAMSSDASLCCQRVALQCITKPATLAKVSSALHHTSAYCSSKSVVFHCSSTLTSVKDDLPACSGLGLSVVEQHLGPAPGCGPRCAPVFGRPIGELGEAAAPQTPVWRSPHPQARKAATQVQPPFQSIDRCDQSTPQGDTAAATPAQLSLGAGQDCMHRCGQAISTFGSLHRPASPHCMRRHLQLSVHLWQAAQGLPGGTCKHCLLNPTCGSLRRASRRWPRWLARGVLCRLSSVRRGVCLRSRLMSSSLVRAFPCRSSSVRQDIPCTGHTEQLWDCPCFLRPADAAPLGRTVQHRDPSRRLQLVVAWKSRSMRHRTCVVVTSSQ